MGLSPEPMLVGVALTVSRFVVNGGPSRLDPGDPHGQCDSSVCPAPAGRTMPTVREPPVDYQHLVMVRHLDVPSPAFARSRRVTVIIGRTQCQQGHLR